MVLSGNQDLVVTVDSCYLNVIVESIVDKYLSIEDNRVVLSGNQYLGVVIFYIRLISGSNLILIWFN